MTDTPTADAGAVANPADATKPIDAAAIDKPVENEAYLKSLRDENKTRRLENDTLSGKVKSMEAVLMGLQAVLGGKDPKELDAQHAAQLGRDYEATKARLSVFELSATAEADAIVEKHADLKALITDSMPVEEKLRVLRADLSLKGIAAPGAGLPSHAPAQVDGNAKTVITAAELQAMSSADYKKVQADILSGKIILKR